MVDLATIARAVVTGKKETAGLVGQALKEGITAERIVSEAIEVGLEEVAVRYQRHEIYLPEVLLAKRAVEGCMTELGSRVTAELNERIRKYFDRLQGMCVTCRPIKLWNK